LGDVATNVVANVVFWLGLGGAVWLASRRTSRRFRSFFGLSRAGSLHLYLANAGGSGDPSDRRVTVSAHEVRAIQSLGALLGNSAARFPEAVRGLVDSVFLAPAAELVVDVSPADPTAATVGSMVVVGAGARNAVRQRFVDSRLSLMATSTEVLGIDAHPTPIFDNAYVEVMRGTRASEHLAIGTNYAIVERYVDPTTQRCAIYCVGARADSSWLAVEWLVRHWRRLHDRFGDTTFALCLTFPTPTTGDLYLQRYVEPTEVAAVR
jgi:hypothetical protein